MFVVSEQIHAKPKEANKMQKEGAGRYRLPPLLIDSLQSDQTGLRASFNSSRSASLARLRRSLFLLLKTLPGGGSSLRTRASPMGIFFAAGLNESSSARRIRP